MRLKLTVLFTLILITVASLNWHVADDWESRIEVQDMHGSADEADKELKTPLSQSILPTS